MTPNSLHKTIFLRAPKELVWAYLTDPDKIALWFHPPKQPLKAGDALALYGAQSGDRLIWGKVVRAEPHDYLEYTFTVKQMGDAVSTVKWRLDDVPGGTRLSLTHENLPPDAFDLALSLDAGWDDHLNRMRENINAAG